MAVYTGWLWTKLQHKLECTDGRIPEPLLEELHSSLGVIRRLGPLSERGDRAR